MKRGWSAWRSGWGLSPRRIHVGARSRREKTPDHFLSSGIGGLLNAARRQQFSQVSEAEKGRGVYGGKLLKTVTTSDIAAQDRFPATKIWPDVGKEKYRRYGH